MPEDPLRGNEDLVRIARSYFASLTSRPVPRTVDSHAAFLPPPSLRSRPRRVVTSVIAFAALAGVLTLVVLGVGHELSTRQGTAATPPPAATSTPTPTVSPPPGGPVPSALTGVWQQPSSDPSNALVLVFNGSRYELQTSGGFSFGMVAVKGDEIDFFLGNVCAIPLPGGVGRYRWSLHNGVLHFTSLGIDPCGGRAGPLANQSYIKQGG